MIEFNWVITMKYKLIKGMFPEYLEEKSIQVNEDKIIIYLFSKRKSCNCPSCNTSSSTVATYFTRKMQDLNIIDKPLFLVIRLAKYRCENPDCNTKVFSERIEELAGTKERRTKRLNEMLTKFSLTQSAEAAARRCSDINIKVSGDTLLRLSKKWEPSIDEDSIYSIGIDDFAF
ncbi:conserved protein of unknown function [[Clostridium] ultunense Esp]|uniref:Transposase IS204/IS1001/IS1096/IS1165 zinc-finger domain-containing protein n=2 Tax=Schnuerera ultunensis TaxID=45497 RepID=A0A1M4PQD2_9FIRM|nr:conserved protein of unknown function [[Clostridium] ultunense Esp]